MHSAFGYIAARLLTALLALLAVSAIIFAAVELLPGDPAAQLLGTYATPERIEAVREQLDLDDPAPLRYVRWLGEVLQGDLGRSVRVDQSVADLIARPALNTAVLAAAAFAAISAVALVLAALGGIREGTRTAAAASGAALIAVSVPEFVIAALLVSVVALELGWLPAVSLVPSGGTPLDRPQILVLPVVSLAAVGGAFGGRMIRAAVADAARLPHVEAARLAGLPERRVLLRHLLPSALPATAQILAFTVPFLIGGAVVVERVFAFPGLGSMLVDRIGSHDAPVIEAIALLQAAAMIAAFTIADLIGFFASPARRTAPA